MCVFPPLGRMLGNPASVAPGFQAGFFFSSQRQQIGNTDRRQAGRGHGRAKKGPVPRWSRRGPGKAIEHNEGDLRRRTLLIVGQRNSSRGQSRRLCLVRFISLRLAGTTYATYEMLDFVQRDCGPGTVVKHLPQLLCARQFGALQAFHSHFSPDVQRD